MFEHAKNTKQQGGIGLAAAIYEYQRLGFIPSLPLTDSQDYDLIIDDGQKLQRVQVKTTSFKQRGNYHVWLTTKGGNQTFSTIKRQVNFDLLFVLCDDGVCYSIPKVAVSDKQHISLYKGYEQYRLATLEGSNPALPIVEMR